MRIVICAGEYSGLMLSDFLRQRIVSLDSKAEVMIINLVAKTDELFGFAAVIPRILRSRYWINSVLGKILCMNPDVVVLIAFSGFNLFLGRKLRKSGIKVIYIAPPQIWAWGKFRIDMLRKAADRVICLFRFEQKPLLKAGINAIYYGYPFYDLITPGRYCEQMAQLLGGNNDFRYIAFLPGTRKQEIQYHQPLFIHVYKQLSLRYPWLKGIIVGGWQADLPAGMIMVDRALRYDVIAQCDVAVVVSGTVTAEVAILGVPMVVCYHLSTLNRLIARFLVHTPYFAIPNIIAQNRIVPEYLEPNERQVYSAVCRMLDDRRYRAEMVTKLRSVRAQLVSSGATDKIAAEILKISRETIGNE